MNPLDYTITDINGTSVTLRLYAEYTEDSLTFCEDASENGEALYQLVEGFSYEYAVTDGYRLEVPYELSGVVKESKRNISAGRITPGIYVGTLPLNVVDSSCNKAGTFYLEVKSTKSDYRSDYRYMLESITEYCTDLLMQHTSPIVQNFTPDFLTDPETVYQRFAFIKSILDSSEFNEAVHRILSDPVTSWSDTDETVDIRRIKRLGNSGLRQIASSQNRINLPDNHYLKKMNIMDNIPSKISVSRKIETVDTPENRFVKHALEVFLSFCSTVRNLLETSKRINTRSFKEASNLEESLSQVLNHDLFRQISIPSTLPLNSPVLQRKEGYREVLRAWLLFDLAAKLVWKGGDDVYSAGKRDIAQLYEYWLFFKLLEILKEIFQIEPDSIDKLIEPTKDGLGLKLKSGEYTPLNGIYKNRVRNLQVEFSYNRTFSGKAVYPEGGSWTRSMRPDYTLSIWPCDFSKDDAEKNEIISHIHFDAKYRVEGIKEIFSVERTGKEIEKEELDKEKDENRSGTYKRADLLKMHAYKDAIRRTGGAYVLYPGDDITPPLKGFHEIIPGLGAFAIRPSGGDDGSQELKKFIMKIVDHFLNRASQHERMTYYTYDIHGEKNSSEIKEPMPEYYKGKRIRPPADIQVLIGYYQDKQKEWIEKGLYNIRIDGRVTPEMIGAKYLLLYNRTANVTGYLFEILESGPVIWNKTKMINEGYHNPSKDEYFVYNIELCDAQEFAECYWDISKLSNYNSASSPFTASLFELMKVKV